MLAFFPSSTGIRVRRSFHRLSSPRNFRLSNLRLLFLQEKSLTEYADERRSIFRKISDHVHSSSTLYRQNVYFLIRRKKRVDTFPFLDKFIPVSEIDMGLRLLSSKSAPDRRNTRSCTNTSHHKRSSSHHAKTFHQQSDLEIITTPYSHFKLNPNSDAHSIADIEGLWHQPVV